MSATTSVPSAQLDELGDVLSGSGLDAWDYVVAATILVVAIVGGRIARALIRRVVARSRADDFLGDLFGRIANYLFLAFGLVYAMETLGIAAGPVLGALGIVGIALAFAFQDILENFVAGVILQIQRPFTSGDEIVTADHEGTITAVDARTITLATPDGETVRIPSAEVIKNPIINHTQNGRRRTTIQVGVAYDSDLPHARSVALDAVKSVAGVHPHPAPDVLVYGFGASSIDLAVRYWHEPSIASMWRVRNDVAVAVTEAFRAGGITIPFPQRVVHFPGGPEQDNGAPPNADEEP